MLDHRESLERAAARAHKMPFGAELEEGGGVRFRLWAPGQASIGLAIQGTQEVTPMSAEADGWHTLVSPDAGPGSRYAFVLPDGLRVPDPASRFQPDDVHGPSEVIDPSAYEWRDTNWKGRTWREAVIYELHTGAFTREGTFAAIIGRLEHLVRLGITAIQIMPVSDFPGARNWGYDGVLPYAPDSTYGRPEDLKALVDAAHEHGLMVFLDVVYNHFGPEGNYLPVYAPQFFTDRHKTPWGAGINFDGPGCRTVRDFFIHNALYWIEEFHLDGLRLDAVHAILDDSPKHFLEELAERVRALDAERHIHLILENEENQAGRLRRDGANQPYLFTAQWNDDVHHVLHVSATNENKGYYTDYVQNTDMLGRALAEGFAFQGEVMNFRGTPRGEPSGSLPPEAFVSFIQNHDQIGNRAFGERLERIAPPESIRALAAVYLMLPQIPMLFMGEEWNTRAQFPFFCDFGPDLADKVREGRRREFARFPEFQDPATRERIPDPQAASTFESAKLDWDCVEIPPGSQWLAYYKLLLERRRHTILPHLDCIQQSGQYTVVAPEAVCVTWDLKDYGKLTLAANLSSAPAGDFPRSTGSVILFETTPGAGEQATLPPWTVWWAIVLS